MFAFDCDTWTGVCGGVGVLTSVWSLINNANGYLYLEEFTPCLFVNKIYGNSRPCAINPQCACARGFRHLKLILFWRKSETNLGAQRAPVSAGTAFKPRHKSMS